MIKKSKKCKTLTIKQENACQAFVKYGNKSKAYRIAYNTSNMKPATVNRRAKDLFDQGKIKARVKKLQKELANRNNISVDRILQEEKRISYLDPKELFKLEKKEWTLIPVPELPEDVRRAIASFEVVQLKTKYLKTLETIEVKYKYKYKFNDKGKSLERTSRHLGMYNDKLLLGIEENTLHIIITGMAEIMGLGEEWVGDVKAALIKILAKK